MAISFFVVLVFLERGIVADYGRSERNVVVDPLCVVIGKTHAAVGDISSQSTVLDDGG